MNWLAVAALVVLVIAGAIAVLALIGAFMSHDRNDWGNE